MRLFFLFFISLLANTAFGQLPSKVEKLEGKWRFKEGSGYEVWEVKGDKIVGHAFRVLKTGDTSRVEDFFIARVNKTLVYNLRTYTNINGQLVTKERDFYSSKRKMKFVSLTEDLPYSIEFKFGFFNRNKLKILVQGDAHASVEKFTLIRIKE